jgi:hypothetical protein
MPSRKKGAEQPVTILLNRWEREMILRHGYPFEDIERQLIESGDSDLVRVTDKPFWWEQVIGNLGISEREQYEGLRKDAPADQLRVLIERIACALGPL